MSFNSLLVNRCTIERSTDTSNRGVIEKTWAAIATSVRCNIQEGRGEVEQTFAGQGLEADAVLFLLKSQDIKPRTDDDVKDRVIITTPATNATFLVEFVAETTGRNHHLTAAIKRVPSE